MKKEKDYAFILFHGLHDYCLTLILSTTISLGAIALFICGDFPMIAVYMMCSMSLFLIVIGFNDYIDFIEAVKHYERLSIDDKINIGLCNRIRESNCFSL